MLIPGKLYKTNRLLNSMKVGTTMLLLTYKRKMWGTEEIIDFNFLIGNRIETIALYERFIEPYVRELE